MFNNLKKLAQIGLVLFVLARVSGILTVDFETYILVFAPLNLLIGIYELYKKHVSAQGFIYHASILAVLILPWGTVSGLVENALVTNVLVALTAYGLTQCYWGPFWPLELAVDAIALARLALKRVRQIRLPRRQAKTAAVKTQEKVEEKKPQTVPVAASRPVEPARPAPQQAITPPVARPVVPAVTPEIKSAPVMEPKPAYVPEEKPVERPVQPASVPIRQNDPRISNLNSYGGRPFGKVINMLRDSGKDAAIDQYKTDLNAAKKGDTAALERAIKLVEDNLGTDFKARFQKDYLEKPATD